MATHRLLHRVPALLGLGALALLPLACGQNAATLRPLPVPAARFLAGTVREVGGQPAAGAVVTVEPIEAGWPASVWRQLEAAGAVAGGTAAAAPGILASAEAAPGGGGAAVGTMGALPPAAAPAAVERATTTDARGRFLFADLAPGAYRVASTARHHLGAALVTRVPELLDPASPDTTFVDIALVPTGKFLGDVRLQNMTVHRGTVVYIAATSNVAVTDATGRYEMTDVPIGFHTISATREGWLDRSITGTLSFAGDSVAVGVLTLPRTLNIEPIAQPSGPPVALVGVPVSLTAAGNDPDGTVVLYEWDFEDDGTVDYTSATPGAVSHTYTAEVPRAKLRVTDDRGAIGLAVLNVAVYDALYIANTGSDLNSGQRSAPKATLAAARTFGATWGITTFRVALGVYNEAFVVGPQADITGGYSLPAWTRLPGNRSIFNMPAGTPAQAQSPAAWTGTSLTGLDLRAASNPGGNSVALYIADVANSAAFSDCRFAAGLAGTGTAGPAGTPGASGGPGGGGTPGVSGGNSGGNGGTGGTGATAGGAGGLGGYSSGAGANGNAGVGGASGGGGGAASPGCFTQGGSGGAGTFGANGGNGGVGAAATTGGGTGGTAVWTPNNGNAGGVGTSGGGAGGGGGGGGGAGSFPCTADRAGGGGGGGAGGAPGLPGQGGRGGYASIAVLFNASGVGTATFTNCIFSTGNGGNGGVGGNGGTGGNGGSGGPGGAPADDAGPGGNGGTGGKGGVGGGGSGGPGGWCVGFYATTGSFYTITSPTYLLGFPGSGGAGGFSGGTGAQAPAGPAGQSFNTYLGS